MAANPLRRDFRVGEFATEPRSQILHALSVSQLASAESVVKFIQVPLKVLALNVNVCALNATLELREVVLTQVRAIRLVSGVDASRVVNREVTSHLATNGAVGTKRVRVKHGSCHVHVLADDVAKGHRVNCFQNFGTRVAGFLIDERHNGSLVRVETRSLETALVGVAELRVSSDVRLVTHDVASEQERVIVAHCFTNAVQHVPRGTGAQSVLALDLTGGNAVLRSAHFKNHHDPRTHGNLGRVHDGASQNRELLATRNALPHATLRLVSASRCTARAVSRLNKTDLRSATLRAHRDTVPAQVFEVGIGVRLANDLLGKCCNVRAVAHAYIVPEGCDMPLIERRYPSRFKVKL
jgi:hypothetical protein